MSELEGRSELERGLLLVFSNPRSPEQRATFDRWYDETHLHEVLEVPGVVAATRYELDEDQMLPVDANGIEGRHFLAAYEIEARDLREVRDAILRTSSDRSHSEALELDPLPKMAIFRRLGDRVAE